MKIAITGASGNIGQAVLKELLKLDFIEYFNVLGHKKKTTNKLLKSNRKYKDKIHLIMGSLNNNDVCLELIKDMDLVINMAGVIPPASDKHPKTAVEVNELGVKTLINAIESYNKDIKLIHLSTVDLYGNRTEKHPYGTTQDPLLISPFDIYALTKLRGEFYILESNINNWCVLRQTAMLYDDILFKNISDGIMFQTAFNSPLEWSTAKDTTTLFKRIITSEHNNLLNKDNFWNKCFNIGGVEENKLTYYETLNEGFKIIGGSTKDFFNTNYDSLRNSHGMWFSDSEKLDNLFHYKNESVSDFWASVYKSHKYFSISKIFPKKLIKKIVIDRLLKDENAPRYWINNNDEARVTAFFGGYDEYNNIPKKWDDFYLFSDSEKYIKTKKEPNLINYYFDINKNDKDITIEDLKNVAAAHGGRLTSNTYSNNVYEKLEWETQNKERFIARPYTILRCGHWFNISYKEYAWDFDSLSKKDKIYASIWLDSHKDGENHFYYFDSDFKARIK